MMRKFLLSCRHLRNIKGLRTLLFLVMSLLSVQAMAQTRVTGKVTDAANEALPGVNVVVKGTSSGTQTDADGKYSIDLPADGSPVLIFSFIGYTAKEEVVGNRTLIDVTLAVDSKTLQEVVVVGYGLQRKSDVTGSIASVSGETLKEVPSANLTQALQGRAAGLEIQRIGTQPGSNAQIRIRGERSISGSNDPLIVLDGIPYSGSLNDINPDEIQSIEVLKDASATAIYGSRGANGIILITSKRGRPGPVQVSINSYYGVTTITKKYDVFNSSEYAAMRDASPWTQGYQPEEIEGMQEGRNTDWQDLMYENGYITNNNINISGGNEHSDFSVGTGYFKETTVLPGQDFMRTSLRAALNFNHKKFKFGFNTLNSYSLTNGSQFGLNMFPLLSLSPLMPAYNEDGSINKTPAGNVDDKAGQYNPLLVKENDGEWADRVRRIRLFNTGYAEYEIIEGLSYRLNAGFDFRQEETNQFRGSDTYFRPGQGNTMRIGNSEGWSYTLEHLLNFQKTIAEDHRIGATALFSAQEDQTHGSFLAKDSVNAEFIEYYDPGQSNSSTTNLPVYGGNQARSGLVSYMLRVNYSYKDKYLLTLTGRRDGSSRLGGKYTNYPAASFGWNVHKEAFFSPVEKIVSTLKLRIGYGTTSNQAVAEYSTLGGVINTARGGDNGQYTVPVRYNYGDKIVQGYYVNSSPNTGLDWELTTTTNIGLDFGLLQNRITGTIDWYKAKTDGILYSKTLPSSSGIPGAYIDNVGEMENKGMEIQLSADIITASNGFTWSVDMNVFWNRNKLLKLSSGFDKDVANGLHIGQPLSAIYDYKKLGIWQADEAAEAATFGQVPGQIKIADLAGGSDGGPDGIINEADRTIIGNAQADWQGGITNRFNFKGFDFSFVTYIRMGGTLYSGVYAPYSSYISLLDGKRNTVDVDYWTPENPTNAFPAPLATVTPPNAATAWSTLGYYDASFIKIRSINVGYSLPQSWLETIGFRSARVYFTAQNPFLLYSPYRKDVGGLDPEPTGTGATGFISTGGNIPNRALTIGLTTPPTRSFIFGINLGF